MEDLSGNWGEMRPPDCVTFPAEGSKPAKVRDRILGLFHSDPCQRLHRRASGSSLLVVEISLKNKF